MFCSCSLIVSLSIDSGETSWVSGIVVGVGGVLVRTCMLLGGRHGAVGCGRMTGFGGVQPAALELDGDKDERSDCDLPRVSGHLQHFPLSLHVEQTGCWPSHLVFVRWHGTQACATRVGGAEGPWSTICLRRVSLGSR